METITIGVIVSFVIALVSLIVAFTRKSSSTSTASTPITATSPLLFDRGNVSLKLGANLETSTDGKLITSATPSFTSLKLGSTGTVTGMLSGHSVAQSTAGAYTIQFGCTFAKAPNVVITSDYNGISYSVSVFVTSVSPTAFSVSILNGPNSHFENFSGFYWLAMCG